jgi:chromatin remodeling complex protein RSC6
MVDFDFNIAESKIECMFLKLHSQIDSIKKCMKELTGEIRDIEKETKKQFKTYSKVIQKKKKSAKAPSGFAKPTPVTKDLCNFLNVDEGSKVARTEVTKSIINYIKSNNLQKLSNKKVFSPDEKLKELLGIVEEEVDYFSLQKHMNKHFISDSVSIPKSDNDNITNQI